MNDINFDSISGSYEKNALVQRSASKILLNILNISNKEDVLDLGCGPGNITREISAITDGRILGVDVSEGMISEAQKRDADLHNIKYLVRNCNNLDLLEKYNVIYCNSAFQWFSDPEIALKECFNVLAPNGRMGIQAPAKADFCPNFIDAIGKVNEIDSMKEVFKYFRNPWLFLESAEEYKMIFENCGFIVDKAQIVAEISYYTPEEVYRIFKSGAENGYLNSDFYSVALSDVYIKQFRDIIKDAIKEQVDENGFVKLVFNRIYLVAHKPAV